VFMQRVSVHILQFFFTATAIAILVFTWEAHAQGSGFLLLLVQHSLLPSATWTQKHRQRVLRVENDLDTTSSQDSRGPLAAII
jgi:hypothetical protein